MIIFTDSLISRTVSRGSRRRMETLLIKPRHWKYVMLSHASMFSLINSLELVHNKEELRTSISIVFGLKSFTT